jgi:predicted secreted acid phosphatase
VTTAKGSTSDRWTSFEMKLREPAPMPGAFDFIRFVASSITFMTHLSEVTVYLDDKRLAKLTKAPGVPKAVEIPKGLKRSSALNIMRITGVKSTRMYLRSQSASASHLLYAHQH